jgi:hypothetical protein
MNPLEMAKGVYEAIKKYNDVPLMKQVVELQQALLEQQNEIGKLTQELRATKTQLELRGKVIRRENGFYFENETDPLCPSCWQGEEKVVRLGPPTWRTGGTGYACPVCDKFFQHGFRGV